MISSLLTDDMSEAYVVMLVFVLFMYALLAAFREKAVPFVGCTLLCMLSVRQCCSTAACSAAVAFNLLLMAGLAMMCACVYGTEHEIPEDQGSVVRSML